MYDEKKEHGIYAGLKFYEDMCNIRKKKAETQTPNKHLSWSEDLEEVYHSVAWVIMAHNIWYLRDGECDENELKKYKSKKLDYLILNNEKNNANCYTYYPIRFSTYPLLFLFCLIDTIEPIKTSCLYTNIDISFKKHQIIIESKDSEYINKVRSMNLWLTNIDIISNSKVIINI